MDDPYSYFTPLQTACYYGVTRAALALIESNADLETTRALHVASERGHSEIIAALVRSNADIEATDNHGETALSHACKSSNVHTLIELNANLDHRTRDGWTPLFIASYYGNLPVLKALLAAGADPELSEYENAFTPLDAACILRQPRMLKTLIAAGAVFANRSNRSPQIRQILADAARPWSPDRHFLRGFPARSAIKTLLLCAQRTYLPAWPVVMIHIN
jgi:ankyrin repeat protein